MSLFDRITKLIPTPVLHKIDASLQRVIYQSGAGQPFQHLQQRVEQLENTDDTRLMLEYFETRVDNIYSNLVKTPTFGPPPAPLPPSLPPDFFTSFAERVRADVVRLHEHHLAVPIVTRSNGSKAAADEVVGDAHSYLTVHQKRLEVTLRLLSALKLPPRHQVLVDIGSWAPMVPMTKRLLPDHDIVCVSAPDELPPEDATKLPRVRWMNLDVEHEPLPLPDESANVVLLLEVIEHFYRDPMFVIAEINRVLVPGGKLLLSTPNLASWRAIAAQLTHFSPYTYGKYAPNHPRNRHVHEYVPRDIDLLLGAGGFDVKVSTENVYHSDHSEPVIELLRHLGLSPELRDDTIFAVATKMGPVRDRYPIDLYDRELISQS